MHDRVELIRNMAQQIIDEAEKIDPKVPYWYDLTITINIPTLTDDRFNAPYIDVSYSHYAKPEVVEKYMFGEDSK